MNYMGAAVGFLALLGLWLAFMYVNSKIGRGAA